jgi:hypothetical protein
VGTPQKFSKPPKPQKFSKPPKSQKFSKPGVQNTHWGEPWVEGSVQGEGKNKRGSEK